MPAYAAFTAAALRDADEGGWQPLPEVVLQYTQSKSKVGGPPAHEQLPLEHSRPVP
jgi:hypothetical protein